MWPSIVPESEKADNADRLRIVPEGIAPASPTGVQMANRLLRSSVQFVEHVLQVVKLLAGVAQLSF